MYVDLMAGCGDLILYRYAPANAETWDAQADLIHILEVKFGAPEAYVETFINICVDCGLEQYHARWLPGFAESNTMRTLGCLYHATILQVSPPLSPSVHSMLHASQQED